MIPKVVGPFVKSSYSGQNSNCVEVAPTADGGRAVRDSKDHSTPVLHIDSTPWQAFLGGARGGEFDR